MQGLPASVIIDARPRSDRPAVVQLPIQRTHGPWPLTPQMLSAQLNNFRLLYLAQVHKSLKVLGLAVLAQHISQNAFIAALILLMGLHHLRSNIEVLGLGKGANRPHFRERLKSILRHESWKLLQVILGWGQAVPDGPVVHVSVVMLIGNCLKIRAGRTRGIRRGIRVLLDSAL